MTEAQYEEAIKQRWITEWVALHPTIPFVLDNESLDSVANWARLTIIATTRGQTTMGSNPKHETRGQIMVQLFGSIETGGAALAGLCGDVRTIFERKRFGSPAVIVTYEGASRGPTTDGRWYMRIVSVAFDVEEQS